MEISLHYNYREEDLLKLFNINELVQLVLKAECMPENCEVAISFVDNIEIKRLNAQYRNIDKSTDVLSFECDGIEDDFDDFKPYAIDNTGSTHANENMELPPFELGDIFIAPDIAETQAPEYGLSFADETSLLITHGLLHLCGYDHMDDEEAQEMETRETELLSKFWNKKFMRHNTQES